MTSSQPRLESGTVLQDTYEIVRRLGMGGMGEVYEARHRRLPGRFAVKVLSATVSAGSADFLRFQREAEIASSLRHPNIVHVVDFNQMDGGAPYIVMELLEGKDLAAALEPRRPMPPARVARIIEQVASALGAAHGHGVVHRDLKPQNLFLVPVGEDQEFAKVLDFGISKVRTAATLTDGAALIGTPQYMAPEQAESRADDVDGRTDQFALAAIAYEMLAGRTPFAGDSVPAILFKIAREDPASLAPLVGDAIDVVIQKALAKNKERRFVSILEFAQALTAAATGAPAAQMAVKTLVSGATARPGGAPVKRWVFGLAAAAVAALMVAALFLSSGTSRAPAPSQQPRTPTIATTPTLVPSEPAPAAVVQPPAARKMRARSTPARDLLSPRNQGDSPAEGPRGRDGDGATENSNEPAGAKQRSKFILRL